MRPTRTLAIVLTAVLCLLSPSLAADAKAPAKIDHDVFEIPDGADVKAIHIHHGG